MKLEEVREYFKRLIEIYAEEQSLKNNVNWLLEQAEKVEYLERRKEEILVESGKRWTKLIKIQDILKED